ncbi:UNVERIFIED_CONTAM: hypothetical protein GTU68_040113, partial [Idotea baltica]|nr:hypothetical protein [Idotea baltica]
MYFVGAGQRKKLQEGNTKQDQSYKLEAEKVIAEAKLKAEKTISEAKLKAEKTFAEFKEKQEAFKKEKIKESREKFQRFKEEFKQEKADELVELKEKRLEKIAGLSQADAKTRLLEDVRNKTANEALNLKRELLEDAREEAAKDARKVVINTIQRMCAEMTIENTVSVFALDNDNVKGQIIGREGRNIRAIEAATGAELVVDDTPETIVISSFDPIRREIARLSLKRLVTDGRIHPARVEEVVNKTRKELTQQIMEIGKKTVVELDIHGLPNELVRYVGRMRFRSSYGQNLLKHSVETAHLCATMAAEMGLNKKQIKLAKRAGLLHDIGKVAEEDSELSHALYGMALCEKLKEDAIVVNAVGAHHDEIEMNNIISCIVQACDAISGARPGARRE